MKWAGAALVALLLAACAAPPVATPSAALAHAQVRSGRLALSVQDRPGDSFSSAFELRGRPEAGQLTLLNPLGTVVAVLRWQPGSATLEAQGRAPQQFDSLQAMVEQATGAPIPVAALFDWLDGTATPVAGWQVDLSSLADGRLRAHRQAPPPEAGLRIVLDPS